MLDFRVRLTSITAKESQLLQYLIENMTSSVSVSSRKKGKVSQKERFHLLACGYLRKYFRLNNPKDIAHIVAKFLPIDWKFDYFYDYYNKWIPKVANIHGIYNDGKTIKCNRDEYCCCFFSCIIWYAAKFRYLLNKIED